MFIMHHGLQYPLQCVEIDVHPAPRVAIPTLTHQQLRVYLQHPTPSPWEAFAANCDARFIRHHPPPMETQLHAIMGMSETDGHTHIHIYMGMFIFKHVNIYIYIHIYNLDLSILNIYIYIYIYVYIDTYIWGGSFLAVFLYRNLLRIPSQSQS